MEDASYTMMMIKTVNPSNEPITVTELTTLSPSVYSCSKFRSSRHGLGTIIEKVLVVASVV
jgi:hypothetical protein